MNAFSPPNSALDQSQLTYLPIFLGLTGRVALLIGGGEAAVAKLDLLRRAGARVRLVASNPDPFLRQRIADDRMIACVREPLAAHHFAHAVLAIDASGDEATNRASVRLAQAAGVPINVVDRPATCDFILPAILDRSPIIVAVSTGGLAPAIARLIRQRLETAIPAGLGRVAALAARVRHLVRQHLCSASQRTSFWENLFDGPAAELAMAGHMDGAVAAAHALIEHSARARPDGGAVHLVGTGSGDPELLTVRAARLIRMADIVLYEPAVGRAILDLARRDAIKVKVHAGFAGRPHGAPDVPAQYVRPGHATVYLRAGG
jgi:uroporphyrin-III C-methyltransferase / precorrin-2 dehydrogenase / sirohydrochlorin ferrochelatase